MPNTLKVPFFRQETEAGCLPACAQMVLSYLGIARSQAALARMLGTHPAAGTSYSRIVQLRSLGVEVVYRAGDLDDVARWLAQGQPVIAFVQLRELPYWDGHWAQHALVIIGLDETTVQVLDPARDEQVIPIPRTDFTLAWDEMDNTCAVLTRRT